MILAVELIQSIVYKYFINYVFHYGAYHAINSFDDVYFIAFLVYDDKPEGNYILHLILDSLNSKWGRC